MRAALLFSFLADGLVEYWNAPYAEWLWIAVSRPQRRHCACDCGSGSVVKGDRTAGFHDWVRQLSMKELLFVYGTLRRAVGHPIHDLLLNHADYVGMGRYAGLLFDVGRYPAVVPDPGGGGSVVGEVYRLRAADAVLPVLDRYEGCTDREDAAAEYRRVVQPVRMDDGNRREAWIYLYNHRTEGLRPIAGGDYLRR